VAATVGNGGRRPAEKCLVYGAGKIGKSTLCAMLAEVGMKVAFLDVGDSCSHLDVPIYQPTPTTYLEIRAALQNHSFWDQFDAVVLDDMTTAEELALAHVLATKRVDGKPAEGIEDYGWGKGYVYVFEASIALLADLDQLARRGKHIVIVSHVLVENAKNPDGTDYQQYQPRLRQNKNAQFRSRVLEWVYHCLFVGMDTFVSKGGKATGSTRTIHTVTTVTHWAGSRAQLPPTIPYPDGEDYAAVWRHIFGKE
jgi:hypothetical protein